LTALLGDRRSCSWRLALLHGQQLLSKHRNLTRCVDTQSNLAAVDIHYCDADIFAYADFFAESTCKYQHVASLLIREPLVSVLPRLYVMEQRVDEEGITFSLKRARIPYRNTDTKTIRSTVLSTGKSLTAASLST
jgi:hypothetical protein